MTTSIQASSAPVYLLDVNVLIAAIWTTHSQHLKVDAWLQGKNVALCPISEIGFLRISTHKKALAASMADSNRLLDDFYQNVNPEFVAADASAHGLKATTSDDVTDAYLVNLARNHSMKLATLDTGITHSVVEFIK